MANPRFNKQVAQPRGTKWWQSKKNGWWNVYKKKRYGSRVTTKMIWV